jgi:hypothetical protein
LSNPVTNESAMTLMARFEWGTCPAECLPRVVEGSFVEAIGRGECD